MQYNKVCITGIAGFIGSHLASHLISKGYKVYGIDDLSTGSLDNLSHISKYVDVSINSIMNFNAVNSIISDCDVVYHLAAAVGVEYICKNKLNSILTNVRGTENVLEACSYRKKKVVIASTSEIYGKNNDEEFSEDSDRVYGQTIINRWSYACSKSLDEFMAYAYHSEKNLPMTIVRFFNIVGERQTGNYGMVIPRFVDAALNDRDIVIYGNGEQKRCFAYVGDIAIALEHIIKTSKTDGQVYNLGNTEEISINDLARLIINKTASKSGIIYKSYNEIFGDYFEDMNKRKPDISKALAHLNFHPDTNLDTILDKIIKYKMEKKYEHISNS